MEKGFLFDFMGEHGQQVTQWMAGLPEKSFWAGGVKADKHRLLSVGAFRCTSCGLLELYARPEFEAK
jgi:hypothetical protein